MNKLIYEVKVPGRICVFGDKVDLLQKPVIGATINSIMRTKLIKKNDSSVEFYSKNLDFRIKFDLNDPPDYNHPLGYWSAVVNRLKDRIGGFYAEVDSDIPIGAGLSSSAAITISLIKALNKAYNLGFEKEYIAELAYLCEHDDLGIMCGRLDQYTIAWGGVSWIETGETPSVEKIPIKSLPVVVGDSQEERKAGSVLNRIKREIVEQKPSTIQAFSEIERVTRLGKDALIKGDYKKVGELMNIQMEQENILGSATEKLNLMCKAAIDAGAYGAKLIGAGGGGCMVAVCPGKEEEVADAIKSVGGNPWIFEIYNYNGHN